MFLGYDLKVYLKQAKDETGTGGDSRNNSFTWLVDLSRMNKESNEWYGISIINQFQMLITVTNQLGQIYFKWKYNRYMNDYLKTVKSVDDNVGKLMEYLKRMDWIKKYIDYLYIRSGLFPWIMVGYDKRFMYEPSLQIPLVMSYPGHIKENITENALVQNVDLAPTILRRLQVCLCQMICRGIP